MDDQKRRRQQPQGFARRIEIQPPIGRYAAVTIYRVTLRDRETRTVVGYYNGAWTTDQLRTLTLRRREAAEDHAARMRDRCPRDAELITVEEFPAGD